MPRKEKNEMTPHWFPPLWVAIFFGGFGILKICGLIMRIEGGPGKSFWGRLCGACPTSNSRIPSLQPWINIVLPFILVVIGIFGVFGLVRAECTASLIDMTVIDVLSNEVTKHSRAFYASENSVGVKVTRNKVLKGLCPNYAPAIPGHQVGFREENEKIDFDGPWHLGLTLLRWKKTAEGIDVVISIHNAGGAEASRAPHR
jgi:hypothetical protein